MQDRMRVPSMLLSLGLTWAVMFGSAFAQSLDPEPVNPPPFPPRSRPSNLTTNRAVLRPSKPLTNGFTYAAPARASAAAPSASANALQFDSKEKTVNVKSGETEAKFVFAVTNVSKEELTIMSVHTSCGCTAAKLPSTPWVLKPGEGGEVGATMNLAGKFGTVTKTVTVVSTVGSVPLFVKAVLPKDAYEQMQRMGDRSRNLQIAAADRQAVFRGDCARCHVDPTVGKLGKDLYVAACGVCHDAEHRASMVPALRGRPGTFHPDYWTQWIRVGKEGSLMPSFDSSKGGPLTEEQITSLIGYLAGDFAKETPSAPKPAATPGTSVGPAPVKAAGGAL
jgi:mono/diheme cytochrome c family protein